MYLKRLDIQGFKSFANRTSFEFVPGMTTIVGPNGSGKSNVADALRWVLGEQSGRLMRARRLEDVIFAGSSKRQPANAAEITLTLDNSDGWLPLDFAEVAISRRVRRSGESDFFINRKRVRLKDVTDLLMRASATQSSYAIIGQGLVETVLNLRPEERRLLLEEAADVQRYRLRIEESQSQLAATRENVDRVRLLVGEIAPRLAQLERQARRAERHTQITRELTDALRSWYGHLWEEAQSRLRAARAGLALAQQEESRAEAEIKTWNEQLAAVREELSRRRSAITDRASQRQRLTDQIAHLQDRIAGARQRQGGVLGRRQQLQLELEAMEKEMLNLARASVEESRRGLTLEQDLEAARRTLEQVHQELMSLEEEATGMQRQAATAEEKAARARAAFSDAESRLRTVREGRSRSDDERAQQEERRRALVSQMARAARTLTTQRREERRLNEAIVAAVSEQDALKTRILKGQAALAAIEESSRGRDVEMERLQARLNVLSDAQQAYEARTRATTNLPALPSPSAETPVQGLLGVLSSLIRVPKGLDKAIEAALAENLQAMVVEHQKDALAAIEALTKQESGRVVIFPLDSLKEVYPLNIMKERGVQGVASRLVKCEERFRRVVDTLLGRTIVVDDLDTALRVLRRGMGSVVTRDGILLHPVGSIATGRPSSEANVFTRHQELTSIPRAIERLARSHEGAEEELQRLRAAISEDEGTLRAVAETLVTLQEQRSTAQDSLTQDRRLLAQWRGELRWLVTSQQRSAQQTASHVQEIEELAQEKERLLAAAAEAEEVAQYLRSGASMVGQRRQTILQNVTEASTRVASLEGEQRSLVVLRDTHQGSLARLDTQMTSRQAELRALDLESTSISDAADVDWRAVENLSHEMRRYAEELEPAQDTIAALEDQERETQGRETTAHSRLLAAERRRLEAEAELRHRLEDVENLRQRIDADELTVTDRGDVVPVRVSADASWSVSGDGDHESDSRDSIPGGSAADRGSLPPIAGGAIIDPETMQERIQRLRAQLRAVGPVYPQAETEYAELKERHTFLTSQLDDLEAAEGALLQGIEELDHVIGQRFEATFHQVAGEFSRYFATFFGGGKAQLVLTTPDDYRNSGVDIVAQPPGKRLQSLSMLSGGEKALTAVSLLFALLQTNPSPFCVLDEVDAMLDEANVGRFVNALRELAHRSQFIVITHNRRTIGVSDAIYGVSMGEDSVSRVLSLRLSDVSEN
jgi:chromosome segregation protein